MITPISPVARKPERPDKDATSSAAPLLDGTATDPSMPWEAFTFSPLRQVPLNGVSSGPTAMLNAGLQPANYRAQRCAVRGSCPFNQRSSGETFRWTRPCRKSTRPGGVERLPARLRRKAPPRDRRSGDQPQRFLLRGRIGARKTGPSYLTVGRAQHPSCSAAGAPRLRHASREWETSPVGRVNTAGPGIGAPSSAVSRIAAEGPNFGLSRDGAGRRSFSRAGALLRRADADDAGVVVGVGSAVGDGRVGAPGDRPRRPGPWSAAG